jgi:hypothetical protein
MRQVRPPRRDSRNFAPSVGLDDYFPEVVTRYAKPFDLRDKMTTQAQKIFIEKNFSIKGYARALQRFDQIDPHHLTSTGSAGVGRQRLRRIDAGTVVGG